MIVITGPGRSGTSLLAQLYRELGFDPGGWWMSDVQAGLEDKEVWRLNQALCRELRVSAGERGGGALLRLAGTVVRRSEGHLAPALRDPMAEVVDRVRYRRIHPDLMARDRIARAVERYGEQLRELATAREVAKDPQFCFTMEPWLAAGASVEAILLLLRPLDAMVDSRVRAGMLTRRAAHWAKHDYCYGIGLLVESAARHGVPVTTLRYPDFLDDPEELHLSLPLPSHRSLAQFTQALETVRDPSLVHDRR